MTILSFLGFYFRVLSLSIIVIWPRVYFSLFKGFLCLAVRLVNQFSEFNRNLRENFFIFHCFGILLSQQNFDVFLLVFVSESTILRNVISIPSFESIF